MTDDEQLIRDAWAQGTDWNPDTEVALLVDDPNGGDVIEFCRRYSRYKGLPAHVVVGSIRSAEVPLRCDMIQTFELTHPFW